MAGSNEGTVNVTLSLPPSRGTSRRGSSDLGRLGGRGSRRNSLDIYTAEYAVRLNSSNRVAAMEQKTAFHMKVRVGLSHEGESRPST